MKYNNIKTDTTSYTYTQGLSGIPMDQYNSFAIQHDVTVTTPSAGTFTAAALSFTLPNNETMDSNKIGGSTVVGKYNANATTWNGAIFKGASNSLVYFGADGTSYTAGYNGNNFANGTTFGGYFEVPISGWKGN